MNCVCSSEQSNVSLYDLYSDAKKRRLNFNIHEHFCLRASLSTFYLLLLSNQLASYMNDARTAVQNVFILQQSNCSSECVYTAAILLNKSMTKMVKINSLYLRPGN